MSTIKQCMHTLYSLKHNLYEELFVVSQMIPCEFLSQFVALCVSEVCIGHSVKIPNIWCVKWYKVHACDNDLHDVAF